MLVIGILRACVFLYLCGVGKMEMVSFSHQQVHQPVPVVSRLDCDTDDIIPERIQGLDDGRGIVRQLPLE